jgi:hypothetical protein
MTQITQEQMYRMQTEANWMKEKEMNQRCQMWMNCYRVISFVYSNKPDEMKRIWLRKMLYDCMCLEEYKPQFCMTPCEKSFGINKTQNYTEQISETCDWLCKNIEIMNQSVCMFSVLSIINPNLKNKWLMIMNEMTEDLDKRYLVSGECPENECEQQKDIEMTVCITTSTDACPSSVTGSSLYGKKRCRDSTSSDEEESDSESD